MSSIEALGNLDIWTEIFQYFKICWELDSDSEIKEKRKCLLRIALLSPSLTSPALDLLWQDMTSLVPVAQVINVNSEEPVLHFSEAQGGYWTLAESITSTKVRERTYDYLTRIFRLRLAIGPSKETGVGSILSMALCLNPLLPSLKSLDFDFKQWNGVGAWANAIGTLISPSLTSVSYTGVGGALIEGIKTLQCMFSSQDLALSSITYRGQLSPIFLRTCTQFRNLEVLRLSNDPNNAAVQRATSGASIVTVFEKFQNLVDLKVDLRLLPLPDPMTREITPSPLLRTLSVSGNSSDVQAFLWGHIRSSSLESLTIAFFEPPSLTWKVICDKITVNFPHLHSVTFRRVCSTAFPQMLPQDLSSFISRSSMQCFQLDAISHCFTEANISGFLSAWPDLRILSITNDYIIHFSASLLIQLSRVPHLRMVKLPLDLAFLQETLPQEAAALAVSHITKLTVTSLASSPQPLQAKIKIARNLFTLFPSLERITTHSTSSVHITYVAELEELLCSFRSAIVTYLQSKETQRRLRTKKGTAF